MVFCEVWGFWWGDEKEKSGEIDVYAASFFGFVRVSWWLWGRGARWSESPNHWSVVLSICSDDIRFGKGVFAFWSIWFFMIPVTLFDDQIFTRSRYHFLISGLFLKVVIGGPFKNQSQDFFVFAEPFLLFWPLFHQMSRIFDRDFLNFFDHTP